MMLNLSEDQVLLRDASVRFVEREQPPERVRQLHDDPAGFDRSVMPMAGELGWFAMLVPEERGGGSVSGNPLADAALIAELLGRTVQPGPFLSMNVAAGTLAAAGSSPMHDELLGNIVVGTVLVAWAPHDERGELDRGSGVEARRTDAGIVLDGSRGFVQDATEADLLLVPAVLDGSSVQFLVPLAADGVSTRPLNGLDLSRRFAHVDLNGVVVGDDAILSGGWAALDAQLDVAIVLNLAETVGAMDALFEMTVAYAKDRVAFGRPIGSYQAIKHTLADQALYLETSKAAVAAAVSAVSADDEGATELVSMASAYVGDTANDLAQVCLQVHGGIGFTWEHDLHLFLRRIRSNSSLFGEPTWHRERLCSLHGLGCVS